MALSLAIAGASGRIGSLLLAACREASDLECTAALVSASNKSLGQDAGEAAGLAKLGVELSSMTHAEFDVLVDFSLPAALETWIALCAERGSALVTGVTGHSPQQVQALRALAERVPVLAAPNLALGPNLLLRLAQETARSLGPEFGVTIHEVHHEQKLDAPSGTALALGEAVRKASGKSASITFERRGQVVGEHQVTFSSADETLTLSHRADSPALFAQGALRAARWIARQTPGFYAMQDVLASSSQA